MSLKTLPWLSAVALACSTPAVMAQKMTPGLWEHTMSMKSESGKMEAAQKQMQQTMASLPPDQRKMMQDMMAAQGVGIGDKGHSVKICLTKEEAELDQLPKAEEGCTQTSKRTGNVWQIAFKCKGPPPSSGEGTATLQGPGAYTGSFNLLTDVDGKPERVQMTSTGKWLSASCGNVKPVK